jgi:serine/threonine protein kinase
MTGVVLSFLEDVSVGVEHIHSHGIIHRDLKPENIMYDTTEQAWVVIDMGLSRETSADALSPNVCTRWYRPPELLLQATVYSVAVDIWSLGCVFAEVLRAGSPLFAGGTDTEQLQLIFDRVGTPDTTWWSSYSTGWRYGMFVTHTTPATPPPSPWADFDPMYHAFLDGMLDLYPIRRALPFGKKNISM